MAVKYPTLSTAYQQTTHNVTWCADRRKNKSVKYIVIHYTGTDASAKNNCIYFGGANRDASADYFIDKDGSIFKFNGNCANYYSWHCGDGYGAYGITNANSIGIEIVSSGAIFTNAQISALNNLVSAIMEDYGVSKQNVVRHYDASRKHCPLPYAGSSKKDGLWKNLHSVITGGKSGSGSFVVRVNTGKLNVRKGPGTIYRVVTTIKRKEAYTIVETRKVGKSTWGRLKSGAGWINLAYTKRV